MSLFQIFLIISIGFGIIGVLFIKRIYFGKYLIFSALYIISGIIARIISTNPSWAKSYLLLGLMTGAIVFIIPNYFDLRDIDLLEKTIIRSQYIVFPFSLYAFYMYYFKGGMPEEIKLFAGMSITLDPDTLLRGQASHQVRLMLPYSTPPVLSVAMAMCIILLLTNKHLFKKRIRNVLILLFSLIMVLTGSRTGMLGLALSLIVLFIQFFQYNFKIKKWHIFAIAALFVSVAAFFLYGRNITYISKMIMRFSKFSFLEDRHVLVPLDGLIIWFSSLETFLFGIGLGSSINIIGKHTYLPPYFLNSFVTLFTERGILGVFIVYMLISLTISLIKSKRKSLLLRQSNMGICLMTGLFCCIFYEALNCYLLIFVIAVSFMEDRCAILKADITRLIGGILGEHYSHHTHL